MRALLDPFSFLVVSLAGWMNQHQQQVIHYLMEENRVLREQIGNRRMRFRDDQRCFAILPSPALTEALANCRSVLDALLEGKRPNDETIASVTHRQRR